MAQGQFYFCLTHHAVEPYEACKSEDRLGPYDTREQAEQALARVQERNEEWDNDPRYNDDDDDDGEDLSDHPAGGIGPFGPAS